MSNRNNNSYESNRKKRKGQNLLRTLGLLLASALLSCAFMAGFNYVQENFFEKDRNPDNLLTVEEYNDNLLEESDKGLKVKWNDDGSLVLSGKHSDDNIANAALYSFEFATLTLDAGDYTLTVGNDDADKEEFGLKVTYGDTTHYVGADKQVIHLDEETAVTFSVFVKNNRTMFWEKLMPTLVEGTEAGDFYK